MGGPRSPESCPGTSASGPCRPVPMLTAPGQAGGLRWGCPSRQPAVTEAEPPPAPLTPALSARPLSLPDRGKGRVSAAFGLCLGPRRRPPFSGLDKGVPVTAAGADGAIQCLDNSPTKSLWPFCLHPPDSASPTPTPAPPWPFRALRGENSHRPQGREQALEKQRLWPLTPGPQPSLRPKAREAAPSPQALFRGGEENP